MLFTKDYNLEQFLNGTGKDNYDRTYHQLLLQTDEELECNHNYIQYLFPIQKRSIYALFAKTVTKSEISQWHLEKIRENIHDAYERMMQFYETNNHWITPCNHNYKRLSRILESLRLFGLNEEADELFSYLSELYSIYPAIIGEGTYSYWKTSNNV